MKVLQILESAATGVGRHILDLTEGLLLRGHQVHLVYSDVRIDAVFARGLQSLRAVPGFREYCVPMTRNPHGSDIGVIRRLRQYVRSEGPFDLIHCHSTKAGYMGRLGLAGMGVPRIYTPHMLFSMDPTRGRVEKWAAGRAEALLSKCCHCVIAVSKDEYVHARQLGIGDSQLALIPNGTRVAGLTAADRARVRAEWGISVDELCVGYVGRLVPMKAPDILLRAVAGLSDEHRARTRVVMIGDGPMRAGLGKLAEDLEIQERIVWVGAVDARPVMTAFDVLALTSVSEGHPLVVLECMARGIPVVASAVGGIPETVRDGIDGFICATGDSRQFTLRLRDLIADPVLRSRMGSSAGERAREFPVDRMVEQTVELYNRTIAFGPASCGAAAASSEIKT